MDTLAKQKLIDTRDFLVEVVITGKYDTSTIASMVILHRAKEHGFVVLDYVHHKIELTTKGHAFINEHKDLV